MIIYGAYQSGDEYGFVHGELFDNKEDCFKFIEEIAMEWNKQATSLSESLTDEEKESYMTNFYTLMKKDVEGNYSNGTDKIRLDIFELNK